MPAKAEKTKTICRSTMLTGSRMPTRSCHTAKEWDDVDSGRARNVDRANLELMTTSKVQTDHVGTSNF